MLCAYFTENDMTNEMVVPNAAAPELLLNVKVNDTMTTRRGDTERHVFDDVHTARRTF